MGKQQQKKEALVSGGGPPVSGCGNTTSPQTDQVSRKLCLRRQDLDLAWDSNRSVRARVIDLARSVSVYL